jgi:hypothetical protein
MQLTAEQIQQNWLDFIGFIDDHISEPRKTTLKAFYEKYEDRIVLMPAAHKKEYHNAFPGGYVEHVNRVVTCALHLHKLWGDMGADLDTFTKEELVFSALNHDLGKMGSETEESYIPQTDNWRREKLGEDYMFNTKVPFASVPDRGLFTCSNHMVSNIHLMRCYQSRLMMVYMIKQTRNILWLTCQNKNLVLLFHILSTRRI